VENNPLTCSTVSGFKSDSYWLFWRFSSNFSILFQPISVTVYQLVYHSFSHILANPLYCGPVFFPVY
jgi:hypothetical protein